MINLKLTRLRIQRAINGFLDSNSEYILLKQIITINCINTLSAIHKLYFKNKITFQYHRTWKHSSRCVHWDWESVGPAGPSIQVDMKIFGQNEGHDHEQSRTLDVALYNAFIHTYSVNTLSYE